MASDDVCLRYWAAAVQLDAGSDKSVNLDKAEAFVVEAAARGAKLVVLPEVFLWRGPQLQELAVAESIPGPTSTRLAGLARRLAIYLVAGSFLERSATEGRAYNTSLLFSPAGELLARYRKIHLFDVDIAGAVSVRESETRLGGEEVITAATPLGTIGLTICYDLRFPELYRRLALAGAEIVAVPSAFTFHTGAAHWEILVRARAIENLVYVVAANQIGAGMAGVPSFGNSMIVEPWGKPLARAADREMVIYAEIDREDQRRLRAQLPALKHIRFH